MVGMEDFGVCSHEVKTPHSRMAWDFWPWPISLKEGEGSHGVTNLV